LCSCVCDNNIDDYKNPFVNLPYWSSVIECGFLALGRAKYDGGRMDDAMQLLLRWRLGARWARSSPARSPTGTRVPGAAATTPPPLLRATRPSLARRGPVVLRPSAPAHGERRRHGWGSWLVARGASGGGCSRVGWTDRADAQPAPSRSRWACGTRGAPAPMRRRRDPPAGELQAPAAVID
jgi:hypothetical protein